MAKSPGIVHVIAGNVREFAAYRRARRLDNSQVRFVARDEELHGLTNATFVLTGNFRNHWNWSSIQKSIRILEALFGATIREDPY